MQQCFKCLLCLNYAGIIGISLATIKVKFGYSYGRIQQLVTGRYKTRNGTERNQLGHAPLLKIVIFIESSHQVLHM